jgi:hypothetical protein
MIRRWIDAQMMAPLKLAAIARAAGTVRAQYPRDERDPRCRLAALYDVSVGALNQAVKPNRDRFPRDFILSLTKSETTL